MNSQHVALTAQENLKIEVVDQCGWMAGLAVSEIFEDAEEHGKNQVCQLVDENDHVVVVLDCECPDRNHSSPAPDGRDSVIGDLCQQGVVLYYYHSIHEKHHHVCLALKKKAITPASQIGRG